MSDELEVVEANARAFVGVFRDVVLTVWRGDILASDVRMSGRAQELAARRNGRFGAIAYVEPKALQMQDEARTEAARITERGGDRLLAIGVVIPLGGFTGSIARTVTTGIHLVSRSRAPQKVFANTEDAAAWVFERLGHEARDARLLSDAVLAARKRLTP